MPVEVTKGHFGNTRIPSVAGDVGPVVTNELGPGGRHRMVALEDNVTCECGWQSVVGELRICLDHFNEHVQEHRLLVRS